MVGPFAVLSAGKLDGVDEDEVKGEDITAEQVVIGICFGIEGGFLLGGKGRAGGISAEYVVIGIFAGLGARFFSGKGEAGVISAEIVVMGIDFGFLRLFSFRLFATIIARLSFSCLISSLYL